MKPATILIVLVMAATRAHGVVTLDVDGIDFGEYREIRAFAGSVDITALVRIASPTSITVDDALLDPRGALIRLSAYHPDGSELNLGEVRLPDRRPAAAATAPQARAQDEEPRAWQFGRSIDVSNESQWHEDVAGDARPSERRTYHDVTSRIAFQAARSGRRWNSDSAMTLFGTSVQDQALRFGEEGPAAPKLDLSDYRVDLSSERTELRLGHIQFGRHPLLLDGVASRGLRIAHAFGRRLVFSGATVNGTRIVGYDNLFGLKSLDHNISSATLALDLLPERGADLGIRATYLRASLENRLAFDRGEVPDAERNDGFGIVIEGATKSGRAWGRLSWARSDYRNPEDPLLAQGFDLVAVESKARNALQAELQARLLDDAPSGRSLTWYGAFRRIDPLYRSAASSIGADQEVIDQSLSYQGPALTASLRHVRSADNLDDIPTILTTRTRQTSLNLAVAPDRWVDGAWVPGVALALQRVHQFAANRPDPLLSGFNSPSHLPDQVSRVADLRLSWGFTRVSADYTLSYAEQDNRQTGREQADFINLGHSLGINVSATDNVHIGLGGGRTRNREQETALTAYTDSFNVSLGWQPGRRWSLTADYSWVDGFDSRSLAEQRSTSLMAQIGRRFALPLLADRNATGQLYLRFARQRSSNRDNVFGFATAARTWVVQSGISMSF